MNDQFDINHREREKEYVIPSNVMLREKTTKTGVFEI